MKKPAPPNLPTSNFKVNWDEVDALRDLSAPKPPGTFNIAEYCERYKICRSTARSQLASLLRANKITRIVLEKRVYYSPKKETI